MSLISAPLTIPPCNECAGQGSFVTGPYTEVVCEPCNGTGEGIPMCSACNAIPELVDGCEVCQCDARCEFCDTPHTADQMIWGSCLSCFDAAYTRYAAEMGEAAINGYGRAA